MAKKKKEKETIKEAEVTASEKEFNKLLMGMSIPKTCLLYTSDAADD